jgi:hypothetical protein
VKLEICGFVLVKFKTIYKLTTRADLGAIARDITHFVKREVITREVDQADWTRFFGRLPFVSAEITKDTRKVEINIEAETRRQKNCSKFSSNMPRIIMAV